MTQLEVQSADATAPTRNLVAADSMAFISAYTYEWELHRSDWAEGDPRDTPTLGVTVVGRLVNDDDPNRVTVIIQAESTVPFNDNRATARLKCSVAGEFVIDRQVVDLDAFTVREAVILVYPYLRVAVAQAWQMTGLGVPMLPTLDVVKTVGIIDEALGEQLGAAGLAHLGAGDPSAASVSVERTPTKSRRASRKPASKPAV